MGKGAGEKSRFNKFLDESYFAFWFRQWAAGFMIMGVILIIVGAVVSSVVPPEKYKEFAQAQLVTSPDDENYNNWASKVEKVRYDFMNVNPGTLAKTVKGPYVYSRIITKTDVEFTATTVKYTLSISKTFSTTESENPSDEISLLNPSYAQLISATSPEEELLFNEFDAESPNLAGKVKNFFSNEAYKFIGAIGLAKAFAPTYTLVRENGIFPRLFSDSGLGKAVENYARIFEATYLPEIPCNHCLGSGPKPKGIKAVLNNAYNTNPACRFDNDPNQNAFDEFFASGFADADTSNACGTFLLAHKLTTVWSNVSLAHDVLFSLEGNGIRNWYNLQDPSTKGHCGDKLAAAGFFGATEAQIIEICDDFIPKFFPELKTTVFKTPASFTLDASLGLRRLCSPSTLSSSALNNDLAAPPSLVLPVLPPGVTLTLEGSLLSSFNNNTCSTYLSALTDTNGFVNQVYEDSSFDYAPLSNSDVEKLYDYIHDRDKSTKQWFSSYWIADTVAYEDSCAPDCHFHSFAYHAPATAFNASTDVPSILYLLFPEESPSADATNNPTLRARYSITNTAPRVLGNNLNLFSNVTALDSSGLIAWLYPNPGNAGIIRGPPVFDLSVGQFNDLVDMLSDAVSSFITTDYGFGSTNDAGLTQFARGQLACGPTQYPPALDGNSPRCYMEETFFGLVGRPYYYEYAYASYFVPTPKYHNSFTAADSDERNEATVTQMNNLLNGVQSNAAAIFVAPFEEDPTPDYHQRYFWYLMSTYVKASSIPSTSGIFAKRTAFQWLSGFDDAAVDSWGGASGVSTRYAIDPDGDLVTLTVQTGASDILTAYLYVAVNGAGTVSVYTPESVVNAFNLDGLPPTKVSPGSSVTFFSPYLMRNLKVTFESETTDEASGITSTKGSFSDDDWASGSHNITQKNMLPVPGVRGAYISTCNIDLPSSVETFTSDPKDTDSFPTTPAIFADLGTGLVVRVDSCYTFSASTLDSTFPITGAGLGNDQNQIFTQVMRRSVRQISATQSDAYLEQYRQVNDTSLAILLALVIVGGLFVLTGVVFLVFWFMRRNRKLSEKAEMDLVSDPFGEKKSNVGNMKY